MSLSNDIKDAALNMGYCKVGITTADDFEPFVEELRSRGDHYDYWMQSATSLLEGAKPRKTLPSEPCVSDFRMSGSRHARESRKSSRHTVST